MEFQERSLVVLHLPEPLLEFGLAQNTAHPKDGLFLYGPYLKPGKTPDVRVGVVGTPAGITHFRAWMAEIRKGIAVPPPGKGEKQDRLHLANFPGLEEAFQIAIDERSLVALTLDAKLIDTTRAFSTTMRPSPKSLTFTRLASDGISQMTSGRSIFGSWSCRNWFSNAAGRTPSVPACQWRRAISERSSGNAPTCLS